MASCDRADVSSLTASALVEAERETFLDLPDARKRGNNQRDTLLAAGLAAFSVFFTQNPSFLPHLSAVLASLILLA
jgi:hypothetical protein